MTGSIWGEFPGQASTLSSHRKRRSLAMKIQKLVLFVIVSLAVILSAYRQAWSQAESGTISGTVSDSTGAVVPGASVKAKAVATGSERTVQTGEAGHYVIPGLVPGIYEITVTSANFARPRGELK
jgi:hypothetical protein